MRSPTTRSNSEHLSANIPSELQYRGSKKMRARTVLADFSQSSFGDVCAITDIQIFDGVTLGYESFHASSGDRGRTNSQFSD